MGMEEKIRSAHEARSRWEHGRYILWYKAVRNKYRYCKLIVIQDIIVDYLWDVVPRWKLYSSYAKSCDLGAYYHDTILVDLFVEPLDPLEAAWLSANWCPIDVIKMTCCQSLCRNSVGDHLRHVSSEIFISFQGCTLNTSASFTCLAEWTVTRDLLFNGKGGFAKHFR